MEVFVKCTPFVKKIILKQEGPEPIQVRLDSILGRVIHTTVGRGKGKAQGYEDFPESLHLVLPKSVTKYSWNRVKLTLLGDMYYQIFQREMIVYIEAQIQAGLRIKDAIENFYQYYGITDFEYQYGSARRAWNRHKNESEKKDK